MLIGAGKGLLRRNNTGEYYLEIQISLPNGPEWLDGKCTCSLLGATLVTGEVTVRSTCHVQEAWCVSQEARATHTAVGGRYSRP